MHGAGCGGYAVSGPAAAYIDLAFSVYLDGTPECSHLNVALDPSDVVHGVSRALYIMCVGIVYEYVYKERPRRSTAPC